MLNSESQKNVTGAVIKEVVSLLNSNDYKIVSASKTSTSKRLSLTVELQRNDGSWIRIYFANNAKVPYNTFHVVCARLTFDVELLRNEEAELCESVIDALDRVYCKFYNNLVS